MTKITTIGLDLAKTIFQVHGATEDGTPALRRKLRRSEVLSFFGKQPPGDLIVMVTPGVRSLVEAASRPR